MKTFFIVFLLVSINYATSRRLIKKQILPPPPPPGGGITTFNFASSNANPNSDPIITAWQKTTGYSPYVVSSLADVNKIQYSSKFVYIAAAGLPSYNIGPWSANPNTAQDQNSAYKFPRVPTENIGIKRGVGLGNIGIMKNGIGLFNPEDGMSYNSLGVWRRNAYFFEKISFDKCNGHPERNGRYHVHITPNCLFDQNDSSKHSPILGFAFDGFPIYGPFGYSNSLNSNSGIKRIQSSYRTRNIVKRTNLPNGTELVITKYGPDVSSTYPLGSFIEDYEFIKDSGDLDVYNGRFAITPEYPSGTYAYYITIDANGIPAYPYTIGPYYYGQVVLENFSGKVSVNEVVTTYFQY